ncbi:MAG: hypothetical protein ABFS41_09255 [Myxococcota bacterium]
MRRTAVLAAFLLLGAPGCAGDDGSGPAPDPTAGLTLIEDPALVGFYERAKAFYGRLARRRFDSIETYQDERLRGFFATEEEYADYYADLTSAFVEHHFDKNRPVDLEVVEFALEGPGRARVSTRFEGRDSRPLRRGTVAFEREDRWERQDGVWHIVPGPG